MRKLPWLRRERDPQPGDFIRIDEQLHMVQTVHFNSDLLESVELVTLADLLTSYVAVIGGDEGDPVMLADSLIAAGWTPPDDA